MGRRMAAALGVVLLLAAGCGSDDEGDGTAATTAARASETAGDEPVLLPVQVDALPEDFSASFFSYFPQQLSARPGDTVQFTSRFTGEPHTVAFGKVIDEALAAYGAVPPGTPVPAEAKALLDKAPAFFAPTETRVDADPQPAAAQPCFLAHGDPPLQAACTDQPAEPPAFDGTQSLFSSGFLPDEETFDVTLADDIAPGTYRFMCLVDRTEMTGTLTVVEPGQSVPSPEEVQEDAQEQIDAAVRTARPLAETTRAVNDPTAATAGAPEPESGNAAGVGQVHSTVNVFPDEVSLPAGGTVSWAVHGAHMIAFNNPEDARPLYAFDAQGVVRANKKGANPVNSPPPRPPGPAPVVVDGGQFDGTGFRNSGLLVGEGDVTYRLRFTKPGTYTYVCLFHTDMEGSVRVS